MVDNYELINDDFKKFFKSPECMSGYAHSENWVLDNTFFDRWNKYIVPGIHRMFGINTLPHMLKDDPLYLEKYNSTKTIEFVRDTIKSDELGIQGRQN